jgi:hypothetical protein
MGMKTKDKNLFEPAPPEEVRRRKIESLKKYCLQDFFQVAGLAYSHHFEPEDIIIRHHVAPHEPLEPGASLFGSGTMASS